MMQNLFCFVNFDPSKVSDTLYGWNLRLNHHHPMSCLLYRWSWKAIISPEVALRSLVDVAKQLDTIQPSCTRIIIDLIAEWLSQMRMLRCFPVRRY